VEKGAVFLDGVEGFAVGDAGVVGANAREGDGPWWRLENLEGRRW